MTEHVNNQYSDEQDHFGTDLEDKILSRVSGFKVPGGKTPETALTDFKKLISDRKIKISSSKTGKARMIWSLGSIAAGMALLTGLWQIYNLITITKVNASRGTHTEYVLSDGTEVQLNAESQITFNKNSYDSKRELTLKGEAFFNVKAGSSFSIKTPNGRIMVLGTSFNVFSRDNLFIVTCLSGKVMVMSANQTVTISQGETAELSEGKLKRYRNDKLQYVTGWIDGEFYFENTPLNLVFKEIERQFNVKFTGRERQDEFFTGSFENKDLKVALEIVCLPMGLNFEIDKNGQIFVSNRK